VSKDRFAHGHTRRYIMFKVFICTDKKAL
jgi:hypothetical protein